MENFLYEEEFVLNSKGYGVECSLFMRGTGIRLAQAGFAVFGVDYEGHGKSDGHLRCYITSFDDIVDDCIDFFQSIREKEEYKNKASFLLGESMGGVVALRIHRRQPNNWNGAILVAPMCNISEELKPSPMVVSILCKLANVFPTWKVVPTRDIIETGFKDPLKRAEMRANPYTYQGKPRLKTGLELLNASLDMEQRMEEVTLPFLVLHGEKDVITDASVSKGLYESASSIDKSIIMYEGMWHGLLFGEPDNNIDHVIRDIIAWLSKRCGNVGSVTSPSMQPQVTHNDLFLVDHHKGKVFSPLAI
ncbi:hypothetical protein GOP47_0004211 [Adiantum capillus-veneris]|uniref:Serine aminopeptidase S33 domain-containing protein n=1 Tax=Adiantum capillus-veneris TaxID=13818 RepID=A0A9D4V7G9_ADICA|nr:hypothetical protein GOP47_0004211 [Adiantum capillus-veneris]